MKMLRLLAAGVLLAAFPSFAQQAILQGGPWASGHIPVYVGPQSSQPILMDSGPAGGGDIGTGISEYAVTATGTGTAPYSGQGTGPFGSIGCMYDAPITNATGYHFLCFSPNATGSTGLISYGAGGIATPLPLLFNVNGVSFSPNGGFAGLVVGYTPISGGTSGAIEANVGGILTEILTTGSGNVVRATSPTLATPILTSPTMSGPALGTPVSGTLTNATGLPISTGVSGLGASVATFLGTPSSLNLRTALTDGTGTGVNVFATSPTLVTPVLGAATGTSLNLSGLTASSAVATDGSKSLISVTNTGSGNNVLATSPTLVTPALGTPTSVVLTSGTGLPVSTGVAGLGTGVATALGVNANALGGIVTTLGACTTYTPTVAFTGGTGTGSSGVVGASCQTGKLLTVRVSATITYTGAPSNVSFSLPGGLSGIAAQTQSLPALNVTLATLQEGLVLSGSPTQIIVTSPTNTTPLTASGQVLEANGVIEVQ